MAKITPYLNGDFAPIHGSFVIGPGVSGGLDVEGQKILFEFVEDSKQAEMAVVSRFENDATIVTLTNPYALGAAFDLEGYQVGGHPVLLHLTFMSIGSERPHRIVTYTLSAKRET